MKFTKRFQENDLAGNQVVKQPGAGGSNQALKPSGLLCRVGAFNRQMNGIK